MPRPRRKCKMAGMVKPVVAGLLAVVLIIALFAFEATEQTLDIKSKPPARGPVLQGASAQSKEAGARSEGARVTARPAEPTRVPLIEGRIVDTRLRPVAGGRVLVIRLDTSLPGKLEVGSPTS